MPFNLDVMRYVMALAILLVVVVIVGVIGLEVYRGGPEGTAQVAGLLGTLGLLGGILAGLFRTEQIASGVKQMASSVESQGTVLADVQDKVNGHLDKHIGHTDPEVQALVDQRLRELGIVPQPPPPPPANPTPPGVS